MTTATVATSLGPERPDGKRDPDLREFGVPGDDQGSTLVSGGSILPLDPRSQCRALDFTFQQFIDRAQTFNLRQLGFSGRKDNVILFGPAGVGRTHLAVLRTTTADRGWLVTVAQEDPFHGWKRNAGED